MKRGISPEVVRLKIFLTTRRSHDSRYCADVTVAGERVSRQIDSGATVSYSPSVLILYASSNSHKIYLYLRFVQSKMSRISTEFSSRHTSGQATMLPSAVFRVSNRRFRTHVIDDGGNKPVKQRNSVFSLYRYRQTPICREVVTVSILVLSCISSIGS